MATQSSFITKVITAGSFVVAAALIAPASMGFNGFSTNAFAEESHEGSTGHVGTKGGSGKGKGVSSGKGGAESGTGKGKKGVYQGDSTDFQKGKSDSSGNKGQPVWSSEGIPEGDYGRLNVARAPQKTRDQAAAEAINTITDWSLYSLSLEEVVTAIKNYRLVPIVRVDSPTQSLALYQAVLKANALVVKDGVVVPGDILVQAAIFLASASDKTKPITIETVIAMNTILGVKSPGTGTVTENDTALQVAAEAVRVAIQIGHDAVVPVPVP